MKAQVLRLAWYRFQRTLRGRLGGYVTVALLVALVGGLGMGAVGGARRTQSAFPSFLATSGASDLQIQFFTIGTGPAGSGFSDLRNTNLYSPALARDLGHLPHVRRVAASPTMFLAPLSPKGTPELPAPFRTNEVVTAGSVKGQYFTQDQVVAEQGRLPNPSRPDEVVVSADAARLLHWHVGQVIPMAAFSLQQVESAGTSAPRGPPLLRINAKIVGLVALNNAIVNDSVDRYPTYALFTPALTKAVIAGAGAGFPIYTLRLDHGSKDVPAVERELIHALPEGSFYQFHVTSVFEGQAQTAIKPESIAIGAFGGIALLAALLIASQAISRTVRRNAQDLFVLRALGAGPVMTATDSLLGILGAIVTGAVIACGVCVGLSPASPIGAVRQVDPAPGFDFDWTVLAAGFGIFIVVLGGVAVGLSVIVSRQGSRTSLPPKASRSVSGAMRLGLPAPAIAGIRFAVVRGRGPDAVPVGSALGGAVLAVAVVVSTLTFAGSLNTLVSNPRLYGWNWSYAIEEVGGGNVPPAATHMLARDRLVGSYTGFTDANVQIDGQTVPILISHAKAPITLPILSGHRLQNDRQIVLGGATLRQLHKRVGDSVVVSYGLRKDFPIYVPPTTLRIVGTGTFPAIGTSESLHTSMGTGALVPKGLEPPDFQKAQTDPDPNNNGPTVVVVSLRPGVSPATGLASLQRIAARTSKLVNADPNTGGGNYGVLPAQQPAEIVNYRAMGTTPAILASGLAMGAIVALALTLVASVRRRRRDLALMKTLGFVHRQLSAVVSWQASVTAAFGVVLGVPVGIIVGRALWSLFAHAIDAVPDPTVPASQVALAVVGTLVLANVVALLPGRNAARTPTALLLRTE